ncbi:hypothetical protein LXA43DRAFT_1098125 [Ganoderma leucocontextum]|nr:hypothetical protein LXA43DRAFT_1098125 [Ganoderma leucocontextum]
MSTSALSAGKATPSPSGPPSRVPVTPSQPKAGPSASWCKMAAVPPPPAVWKQTGAAEQADGEDVRELSASEGRTCEDDRDEDNGSVWARFCPEWVAVVAPAATAGAAAAAVTVVAHEDGGRHHVRPRFIQAGHEHEEWPNSDCVYMFKRMQSRLLDASLHLSSPIRRYMNGHLNCELIDPICLLRNSADTLLELRGCNFEVRRHASSTRTSGG